MKRERFDPQELNVDKTRERWSRDPGFVKAYGALADEFAHSAYWSKHANKPQAEDTQRTGTE